MAEANENYPDLPQGWCWVQHKDIAEINPKLPSNDLADDLIVSFLPMASVEEKTGRYELSQVREYAQVKKGYTPFISGDLIFAKITPCMENGKVAIVENLKNNIGFGSTEFHVSRLTSQTNKKYIFYYFIQEVFRRDARKHMTGSAGQLRVPKSYFEDTKIPLPPRSEQDRIVEKIEELSSDLDQGVENLEKAQKQLKVYRQAVLKWAFEGKLTEEWRKQNQSTFKTGEELLAQIKAEREERYQQQLMEWEKAVKEWEAIGKLGKKPTKPQVLTEIPFPTQAELSNTSQIPVSWRWVKVSSILLSPPSNGRSVKDREGGFRVLRLTAIRQGSIDIRASKEGDWDEEDARPYIIQPGDFLLARGNGSINLVGIGGLVSEKSDVAYPDTMIRITIDKSIFIPKLFTLLWNSAYFRKQIEKSARTTAGIYKVNQNHINNFLIPLAPINEQEQIIQEVESRLSICDQLEATITENLQKAEALKQSILKQAFEGKLVPQDPNDEPAEKMLERIREERQTSGNTTKKTKSLHQQLTLQET